MKTSEVISRLVEFDETERPAYVVLYTRDKNGMPIRKQKFPIVSVFSHANDITKICIEHADCIEMFI